MAIDIYATLCRICLEEDAAYPIFECHEYEDSLQSKLSQCFIEKIEDIEGYPRKICRICKNTLETIISFINKFRESCEFLNGLIRIKKEETNNYNDNQASDTDILSDKEAIDIKFGPEDCDNLSDRLSSLVKKQELKITKTKVKQESIGTTNKQNSNVKKRKVRRLITKPINRTNKIASSILEGEFAWTGEKCIKNKNILEPKKKRPPLKQREVQLPKRSKVKTSPEQKLCDLCGEVFNNADKLNAHKKKVHLKTQVKCPECLQSYASDYYLNRHIKRRHGAKKDQVCGECESAFALKSDLRNHIRTVHNKHLRPKRKYSCQFCDKTYACRKSVVLHERSVHTGDRPAVCSVCGNKFSHEDYLKEHMRLHTGETPFKCPICGRGYAQRGNMKSHLRIHRISELDAETLKKLKPSYLKRLKP